MIAISPHNDCAYLFVQIMVEEEFHFPSQAVSDTNCCERGNKTKGKTSARNSTALSSAAAAQRFVESGHMLPKRGNVAFAIETNQQNNINNERKLLPFLHIHKHTHRQRVCRMGNRNVQLLFNVSPPSNKPTDGRRRPTFRHSKAKIDAL